MSVLNVAVLLNICLYFCGVRSYFEDCQSGECKILIECPEVLQQIFNGKRPAPCGFRGPEPMVCCSEEQLLRNVMPRNEGKISRQKCTEYGESIYNVEIPLSLLSEVDLGHFDACPYIPNFLIRGPKADPKEFPHMALIGTNIETEIVWHCSGSLISEQFVLTGANCVRHRRKNETVFKVRLGELQSSPAPNQNDFEAAETFVHPEYNYPEIYNNIALIKLDRQAIFSGNIFPACLPIPTEDSKKYFLTGWSYNSTLLRGVTEKMSDDDCRKAFDDDTLCIGNRELCALNTEPELCFLDSGAPILKYSNVDCMYDIIGLTTFKENGNCTAHPVVYTKVSEYLDWIEKIVWV